MLSIGELSKRANVKVPTIRYYEEMGLLMAPARTDGNQRRFDKAGLERLSFIKHARDLGFSIDAILALIKLQEHPDRTCRAATEIAVDQLDDVRKRIKKLRSLEKELLRITKSCDGQCEAGACHVLASLAEHNRCEHEH